MKHVLLALVASVLFSAAALGQTAIPAATPKPGDPGIAQIEAVLGPQTAVQRTGPGEYVIDGEHVTIQQLLGEMLPQKENTLKTMQGNIQQRQSIQNQAASGVSIDAKRAQCQKLAVDSIERTRCYQELEDLRDRQNQSAGDIADQQKDDELQSDRLQQEIDAIEQFKKQYGGGQPEAK